jgi:hypothetical protein
VTSRKLIKLGGCTTDYSVIPLQNTELNIDLLMMA